MNTTSVHAGVKGFNGAFRGHVSVVRYAADRTPRYTLIAECTHSHRLARAAQSCAMRLGKQATVQKAVGRELAR